MSHKLAIIVVLVIVALLIGTHGGQAYKDINPDSVPMAAQVGTSFTYQGFLTDGGTPANGAYDFELKLFDDASGGVQAGSTVILGDVDVSEGIFTVALDFGEVFDGTALWLEIAVRPGASSGEYTALLPRQGLTAVPYAIHAANAWSLSGNIGLTEGTQYLGTNDDVSLELRVEGEHAFRIEPDFRPAPTPASPNIIGGYVGNGTDYHVWGATISGGGTNDIGGGTPGQNVVSDIFGTIGGGANNLAGDLNGVPENSPYATIGGGEGNGAKGPYATIGGGQMNEVIFGGGEASTIGGGYHNLVDINGDYAVIAGGFYNQVDGHSPTIGGGYMNSVVGSSSFIGGGYENVITSNMATISGGDNNSVDGTGAMIPGGVSNIANGNYSFAAGRRARALHLGSFVWGDSTDANISSTANDQFVVRAGGGMIVTSDDAHAVTGASSLSGGHGLHGVASHTSSVNYGVWGESTSTSGRGLYGRTTTTSGTTYGVYGESASSSGRGVYGAATRTSGINYGVMGESASSGGTGVYGNATSSSGGTGVLGMANSSSGIAGAFISYNGGVALYLRNNTDSNDIIVASTGSFPSVDVEFKVDNAGNVYADGSYSSPASDFAEMLPSRGNTLPGEVLVIGLDGLIAKSSRPYDPSVIGVYSTEPGFVGGSNLDDLTEVELVPVAIMGVVPVKATSENGVIQPGDLLVTASIPGYAMQAGSNPPIGTVIGKALESLEAEAGTIRMLVMLQ